MSGGLRSTGLVLYQPEMDLTVITDKAPQFSNALKLCSSSETDQIVQAASSKPLQPDTPVDANKEQELLHTRSSISTHSGHGSVSQSDTATDTKAGSHRQMHKQISGGKGRKVQRLLSICNLCWMCHCSKHKQKA